MKRILYLLAAFIIYISSGHLSAAEQQQILGLRSPAIRAGIHDEPTRHHLSEIILSDFPLNMLRTYCRWFMSWRRSNGNLIMHNEQQSLPSRLRAFRASR
jgi:hypothetical protein